MKLLDLFCGAGGAAVGYHRAGLDVVGVDHLAQKHYPFEFHCDDAFAFVEKHGQEFDVIHASPPYPKLIDATRGALIETGKLYIIENVMGAKLRAGFLCGTMFGLPFFRHRAFETNWFWLAPPHSPHAYTVRNGRTLGSRARDIVHGQLRRWPANGAQKSGVNVGHAAGVRDARKAMGLDYMTRDELTQAIPPAYTEWIGWQLVRNLTHVQN